MLYQRGRAPEFNEIFGTKYFTFNLDDWVYTHDAAFDRLTRHFQVKSLKGFGIDNLPLGIIASGAILWYLDLTQHRQVSHISNLSRIEEEHYVWLDRFTIRNLELFHTMYEGARSLHQVIDRTISPMGSRLMRRWIAFPLKDPAPITERHDVVESFLNDEPLKENIEEHLRLIGDLERLISKVAVGRINPREVQQVKNSLNAMIPVKAACAGSGNKTLLRFAEQLNPCDTIRERIQKDLSEDPPVMVNRGRVMAPGVSSELDELRGLATSGKDYLVRMQKTLSEQTGITSLKLGFNNVFGYYIEVRNTHKEKVPPEWIRKQTLVGAERYITEELKEYEIKILGAEEKIQELETRLFNELVLALSEYIPAIQLNASVIARIDCLLSFSTCAREYNYNRPEINDTTAIVIKEGRHPVIERLLPVGAADYDHYRSQHGG